MDRNGRVFLAVCISAAVIIVLVTLNLYAINNLHYQFIRLNVDPLTGNQSEIFEICNPTFFPVYFDMLDIDLFYKDTKIGTLTMWGEPRLGTSTRLVDPTLPMSVTIAHAQRNITDPDFSHYLSFEHGRTVVVPEAFDERRLNAVGNIATPIFGIIPFSVPQTFTADALAETRGGQAFTADAFTDVMVLDVPIEKICHFNSYRIGGGSLTCTWC